jgi:hypothetical protein
MGCSIDSPPKGVYQRKVAMSKKALFILTIPLLAVLGSGNLAAQARYDKYLSVADVQKITGLTGIKQVARSEEADGDLNFASQDGNIILAVSIYAASAYSSARSSKQGFKSSLPGVGEDAFVGPADGPPLYILAFRKGAFTVVINTELENKTAARLTMDQLTAIAKLMASRM